jgi:hypothetical protein
MVWEYFIPYYSLERIKSIDKIAQQWYAADPKQRGFPNVINKLPQAHSYG